VPPENPAKSKRTALPENPAPPKSTRPPGELSVVEADRAAGEPGVGKQHDPAGESGAAEIAAVEDHPGEVEVQALPGHCRPGAQMGADEPDDGEADFAAGPECKPLRLRSVIARIRFVGQAQVGAENVDAGLPVLLPVVGQPGHGVHAGQAYRWLGVAELG
jgi:hypothetical protein